MPTQVEIRRELQHLVDELFDLETEHATVRALVDRQGVVLQRIGRNLSAVLSAVLHTETPARRKSRARKRR